MADMLRGRAYSCGCHRSKPGEVESARAIAKREASAEIAVERLTSLEDVMAELGITEDDLAHA